ncbi:MAG: terminase small subunit [Chloroflexi bacterium]|nr:terminase small subunit [Chloroflexota bacterium]
MNTLKRAAFARAYVLSGNATEAAKQAGYSPKTAKQQGSRLLTKADAR